MFGSVSTAKIRVPTLSQNPGPEGVLLSGNETKVPFPSVTFSITLKMDYTQRDAGEAQSRQRFDENALVRAEEVRMGKIWKLWRNQLGQDLIEYALMAGFVAVAAGAVMPGVASSISTIFSKVASVIDEASETGSS